MSETEKVLDRLWWRAWATHKKMDLCTNRKEWKALALHLVSIEDELEQFIEVMA